MKNRPTYAIDSVDHALRLALLLAHEGPQRVADAAERLGVARSTAHRLLAMLVYRDFAIRGADRRYRPGPALRAHPAPAHPLDRLRTIAEPHLNRLRDDTGETVNLIIGVGASARFVYSCVSERILRVDDRAGREMPIELTAGGKALLASMSDAQQAELFAETPGRPADPEALRRELRVIRRRGVALNIEQTEVGLTAVGRVVDLPAECPPAAVTIAMPSARFSRARLPEWTAALALATGAIAEDWTPAAGAP